MFSITVNDCIRNLFQENKKCIVNADLDGILSGMLLQRFLNWRVVGYSSCCGKPDDELWLFDTKEKIKDCIFVDLPVWVNDISTIDQHFVAFEKESVDDYFKKRNKINPNTIRGRVFKTNNGRCEYTGKYPFGTVHFVLAVLENLGKISKDFVFDFRKKLGSFDLADLVLRADRVIGNTAQYTPNCIDWCNWILDIGGHNTKSLFNIVKNEYRFRTNTEHAVEEKLKTFGCAGIDGDCSNLFRDKNYSALNNYLNYLSTCLGIEATPLLNFYNFGKLYGKRFFITSYNYDVVKNESMKDNVFSFAFVTMKSLSLTYIKEKDYE